MQPSLRRDVFTHIYTNSAAFQRHTIQMRHAGWQVLDVIEQGKKTTVTWYRDVPMMMPPNALLPPPPRDGMHPLAIVGIVVGCLVLLIAAASVGKGGNASAIPTAAATSRALSESGTTSAGSSVASTGTATGVRGTPVPSVIPIPAPTMVPQVVTVKDNPVPVREAANPDASVIATLAVGTELSVLGPDVTGTDGATRWVPVAANGKNGFVRSDLVTERRAYVPATSTTIPASAGVTSKPSQTAATSTSPSVQRVEATALPTPTQSPALQARLDDLYDWMFNVGCNLDGQNGVGYPLPTWCPHLKKVGIVNRGTVGDEAYANTDLRSSANDVQLARDVCTALINYAKTDDPSVKIVTVLDVSGRVLDTAGINGKGC